MICWLAGALVERGFRVVLVSWDEPDAMTFFPLHPAVEWKKLGFRSGLLDKFRRTRELTRTLRSNGVNVLLGFVISGDLTVYAASILARTKLVVAERNAPTMYQLRHSYWQRWRSFCLLHLADRITVQWPKFIDGYPRTLRQRILAIPNPVPIASMRASPGSANLDGRFILLALSRLDSVQKRIGCLAEAFALIAGVHPNWDLLIVGDGPDEASLRQKVDDYGLGDRVFFAPATTDAFGAYISAHLFAIPSLWEGFPNALAEALSHGLPAVGFVEAAGVADLIQASGGGWLAAGLNNESALASALNEAMSDHEERNRRATLAIEGMTAYSPDTQFDRWAELLRSVMDNQP